MRIKMITYDLTWDIDFKDMNTHHLLFWWSRSCRKFRAGGTFKFKHNRMKKYED